MQRKNYINFAKKSADIQIKELKKIKKILNISFINAVDLIDNCKGKVIFSGVGKNSFICKKAAATFSSVGIPSFFVDPTGVSHGDAGQIEKKDILIIISNSGNTVELTNLLKFANRFRIKIIGIASNSNSMLIKSSDIKIIFPKLKESDPNNIVPTTSTSFVMMICDCLATTIMEKRKFTKEKFFLFHKGGNLGASLRLAKDIMVTGGRMPVVDCKKKFKSHGDAGQIEKKDILIIISNSGNTVELTNLLKFANRFRIKIIGIASNSNSMLIKSSDIKIIFPKLKESDPNNIVPTTSTSFVMMICDCLATTIMEKRKFTKEKFFLFHKGGNLGASLRLAKDIMVTGGRMPVVDCKKKFNQALKIMNKKKLGIVVVTKNKFIKGLITDGDIRRVINSSSTQKNLDKITRNYPLVINENMPASKALGFMSEKKITSLLVVSDKDKNKKNKILKGIIHIHFLLKDEIR